jgi:hypothetical protein
VECAAAVCATHWVRSVRRNGEGLEERSDDDDVDGGEGREGER